MMDNVDATRWRASLTFIGAGERVSVPRGMGYLTPRLEGQDSTRERSRQYRADQLGLTGGNLLLATA